MNKNTLVIGGIIIVALIAGAVWYNQSSNTITSNNATSTTTGDVTPPIGTTQVPGTPSVTTNKTVAPTDTTAVVTGTVVPNGAITTYWYEYGTTPSLGKKTSNQVVGSGYAAIPTPGYITGLVKNTAYYFRLVAENQYGRVAGDQNTVTTTQNVPAPIGSVPTVKTLAVSGLTNSTAGLNGQVNPNKAATQYWFEYGKNGTLGNTTGFTAVGDGSTIMTASVGIANLDPGTTYYYRINAQNQFGTVNGAILTFKTFGQAAVAVPVVTTQLASPVATTTATLRGTVNPYGTETKYWFEYSTNAQFTSALKSTSHTSAGAGTNTATVEDRISGLKSGTSYFFRIVAQNNGGTVRGDGQTFKTN